MRKLVIRGLRFLFELLFDGMNVRLFIQSHHQSFFLYLKNDSNGMVLKIFLLCLLPFTEGVV